MHTGTGTPATGRGTTMGARRRGVAATLLALGMLALPAAATAGSSQQYVYPLSCGSNGSLELTVVGSGRIGWDAADPSSRFIVKSMTVSYHDFGDAVREASWGRYDATTAWTCTSGAFQLQGFSITVNEAILAPLP